MARPRHLCGSPHNGEAAKFAAGLATQDYQVK